MCPPDQTPNRKGECRRPAGNSPCPNGCFDRNRDPNNCGALAICEAIHPSPTTKCCSTLGGPCEQLLDDSCDVPRSDPNQFDRPVYCAVEGSRTCGGVDALCRDPTLPGSGELGRSRQCVSGTCCYNEAGNAGVCCDFGQECDKNLRCRTRNYEACGQNVECTSGLCCGGVCIPSNAAHCGACNTVCDPTYECVDSRCVAP